MKTSRKYLLFKNNIKYYVFNYHLHLLPNGAIGGLYLGGIGVARVYLNRSEFTEERSISNRRRKERR